RRLNTRCCRHPSRFSASFQTQSTRKTMPAVPSNTPPASTRSTVTLTRPDDWHLHVRDGAIMHDVVAASARQFRRAIIMPNLNPPIRTAVEAQAYRERIMAALAHADVATDAFDPLMTLYLTAETTPDDIRRAQDSGIVHAVKLYPAG